MAITWKSTNNREIPTLLKGMEIGAATMENSMEVPQKTKNKVAIWSSNPIYGHISGENSNSKTDMHPNAYLHIAKIIYTSQDMEAA